MKKVLIIIVFIFSFYLVSCNFTPNQDLKDYGLSQINDKNDLKKLLKKSDSSIGVKWFGITADTDIKTERNDSNDYTKTNVQVAGVDEGDIVKVDGSRIYSITYDRLQVVNLLGDGKMDIMLNERISDSVDKDIYSSYTYYSELYVTDKYLIVIGQKHGPAHIHLDNAQVEEKLVPIFYRYAPMSVVDTYDIDTLEKIDHYEVSGYLIGSRLINENLYLITSYYTYGYYDDDFDIRPWYAHKGSQEYFSYNDIKYIPDTPHNAFTIITNINYKDEIKVKSNVFLSTNSWGQIYVSENAIYFASNYYESFIGSYTQKGIIVSFQFEKNSKDVFYGGYANYEGTVLNQFAIDEYNGYLRLATTEGWAGNAKNRLYIFKRTLKDGEYKLDQVSLLDKGLGKPGESIQSVRFNKDFATVVTFLRTDPLYTIDLSDPLNPFIAGELEVPGFSTYQHPWTDNIIIGIGFEADEFGMTTGLKLSLYDITDKENPIQIGKPLVFDYKTSGWSYTEASYNHKAVMIDKTRNFIGFTINKYYTQLKKNVSEYYVFEVNESNLEPIKVKHTFSHYEYQAKYSNLYYNYYYYDFSIKRSFRVDDYLYVVSGEAITSHNLLNNFSLTDEVIFAEYFNIK